jgi:hypothetical protein
VQLIVFEPEIGAYTTDEETTFAPASVPNREVVPITYGEFTLVEAVTTVELIVFAPEIGPYIAVDAVKVETVILLEPVVGPIKVP